MGEGIRAAARRLAHDHRGAVAAEYAFVIAFIAVIGAAGMAVLGNNLGAFYGTIGSLFSETACEMPDTASDRGKANSNKCKDQ